VSTTGNASEFGQILAALVPKLPEATALALKRLVGHHLATPSAALRRQARLGLLIEMVASGVLPDTEEYMAEREVRRERGEEWPTYSVLINAYGHWLAAQDAAIKLVEIGSRARVASSHHHAVFRRDTLWPEVPEAILLCRTRLDDWPTEWEYYEWANLTRRAARAAGKPEPQLPTAKPVNNLFGNYAEALATAKRFATGDRTPPASVEVGMA
jgi:hypothetical protein